MNKLEIDVAKAGTHFVAAAAPQISSAVSGMVGSVVSAVTSTATTAVGVIAAAAPVLLPVAGIGFLCWGVVKLLDD